MNDWLTIEEIELVAVGFKDDLTREGKRCVRRKNLDRALAVFTCEEYIDLFVDTLRLRAGSRLGRPKEPKKRIRHIYVPDFIKKPSKRVRLTKEQRELQKHAREVTDAARFKGQPKRY